MTTKQTTEQTTEQIKETKSYDQILKNLLDRIEVLETTAIYVNEKLTNINMDIEEHENKIDSLENDFCNFDLEQVERELEYMSDKLDDIDVHIEEEREELDEVINENHEKISEITHIFKERFEEMGLVLDEHYERMGQIQGNIDNHLDEVHEKIEEIDTIQSNLITQKESISNEEETQKESISNEEETQKESTSNKLDLLDQLRELLSSTLLKEKYDELEQKYNNEVICRRNMQSRLNHQWNATKALEKTCTQQRLLIESKDRHINEMKETIKDQTNKLLVIGNLLK